MNNHLKLARDSLRFHERLAGVERQMADNLRPTCQHPKCFKRGEHWYDDYCPEHLEEISLALEQAEYDRLQAQYE